MQGKVVLVTGGARRIGAATCRRLHAAGANVVIHYRASASEAQRLQAELEAVRAKSVALAPADLLDTAALPSLVDAALRAFGRLDGLVNNASSFYATPLGAITSQQWDDLIGTNVRAPLFLAQAAAPALRATRGAIVNIADIHAERPLKDYVVYSIAKAAVVSMTRSLARELAPEVRVNAVAPGPVLWPEDGSFDASMRESIVAQTPLARVGSPEDIAGAVAFLLGEESPYVTGVTLAVDGGRNIVL